MACSGLLLPKPLTSYRVGVPHDAASSSRFPRRRRQHVARQRWHPARPEGPSRAKLRRRYTRPILADPREFVRGTGLSRLYRRLAALPWRTPPPRGAAVYVVLSHGLPFRRPALPGGLGGAEAAAPRGPG